MHLVNGLGLDGTSKVVFDLCMADPQRYEIEVVSLTSNLAMIDREMWNPDVRVKAFNYNYDPDYSLRKYFLLILFRSITAKNARDVIRYLRQVGPDIIHCHLQPRESLIAILAAQGSNAKLVLTDHLPRTSPRASFSLKTYCLARLYRLVYRKFFVVAVSRGVYESQKKFKLFNRSIGHAMVHNRIDSSRFVPDTNRVAAKLRVIYVARLEQRKGHDVLLRAWLNMQKGISAELLLLGGGPLKDSLREMTEGKDLTNPVIFAGDQTDVIPYLQSADIGVFPSQVEGLPIALLEKMSCALPIVASDIPELREVVSHGVNGLLFEANSAEDLQRKLECLLTDATMRRALGSNARKSILERFDSSGFLSDYEGIYRALK